MRTDYDERDFLIYSAENEAYLYLKPLKQYMQRWWDAASDLSGDEWFSTLLDLALYRDQYELNNELVGGNHRLLFWLAQEYISEWRGILSYVIADRHGFIRDQLPPRIKTLRNFAVGVYDVIVERFRRSGKCPCTAERIIETYGLQVQLYISQMKTREMEENHADCTSDMCHFNNIDPATYKPKHAGVNGDSCECAIIEPDMAKVAEILSQPGELPVLMFEEGEEQGAVLLHVVSTKDYPDFAAISYVSSHGLSNPLANSLPSCQLSKLWRVLRISEEALDSDDPGSAVKRPARVGLWLDTLSMLLLHPYGDTRAAT